MLSLRNESPTRVSPSALRQASKADVPVPHGDAVDAASSVSFTLESIREEYLGSEKLVYGEVGGVKAVARMAANEALPAAEHSTVTFGVRRSDLRIFDRESGLRREPASTSL